MGLRIRVLVVASCATCAYAQPTVVVQGTRTLTAPRSVEAERILFRAGAMLVTNGFPLTLRAREIVVEGDARIVSFAPGPRGRGEGGRAAGTIVIVARRVAGGRLTVSNEGEPGSPGREGAPGSAGAAGAPGQPCRRTPLGIVALGSPGAAGSAGGEGAPGTPGGPGGDGGLVLLDIREGAAHVLVSVAGGDGGAGGRGGKGGPGGPGGQGAPENSWGPGTRPGEPGRPGRPGVAGPPGARGADGRFDIPRTAAAVEPPQPTATPPPPTTTLPATPGIPSFPWPPPRASAHVVLERAFFAGAGSFEEVGERLVRAFRKAGYPRHSWYSVPEGFALVSQMEQFSEGGAPREEAVRFAITVAPPRLFSLADFVRALFTASPGRFRIIAFLFTSVPFSQTGAAVDREAASAWVTGGLNVLPEVLAARAPTPAHQCTALVYEFEKPSRGEEVRLADPSALSAEQHLRKAGLWEPLERP